MKRNKHRILVLAALPLTAVLAGGVALAATDSQPAAPTGTSSSTAPTCRQDQARDRDRDRDGSCLQSPSSVPSTMMHHAHGNCGEPDDQSGDE